MTWVRYVFIVYVYTTTVLNRPKNMIDTYISGSKRLLLQIELWNIDFKARIYLAEMENKFHILSFNLDLSIFERFKQV